MTESHPGRPRSAAAHSAILDAVVDQLATHGYGGVAVSRVAEKAGVSTATIYRRWRSKPEMVLAAIEEVILPVQLPDTGSLRSDLVAFLRERARAARTPLYRRAAPALGAEAMRNPALLKAMSNAFLKAVPAQLGMIERARARGEVREDADATLILHALIGGVFHNLLQGQPPLSPRDAERLVDLVMAGVSPR